MLSLTEYSEIANKALIKHNLPVTDDNIGEVVFWMAMADENFDPAKASTPNRDAYRGGGMLLGLHKIRDKMKKESIKKEVPIDIAVKNSSTIRCFTYSEGENYHRHDFNNFLQNTKLPDRTKEILMMRFYDSMTWPEIAKHFNISLAYAALTSKKALEQIGGKLCQEILTN